MDPLTDPRWRILLGRRPSDVFHSPEWLGVLADTYGFRPRARVIEADDGTPMSGFVYVEVDDAMDRRIVSLPFSDFCDPLVSSSDDWDALVTDLLGAGQRVSLRCLHGDAPLGDARFERAGAVGWHCVDLARDPEDIWESLDGSARRAVRKAHAAGIQVKTAESRDDLRSFFELHLGVRKHKYRLLAQPYRLFESIWERFLEPGNGTLLLAVRDRDVVGGILFLRWRDTLYYKFNASAAGALQHRPNDLVLWEGIRMGVASGASRLDFGVSDWDQEGLVRYKRKYATEEKTVHLLRHIPEGSPSEREREMRLLLPRLTDLFVADDVPDHVTEAAGDLLYRYFC